MSFSNAIDPGIASPDYIAYPHKCPQCRMAFSKASGLKRHSKVHRVDNDDDDDEQPRPLPDEPDITVSTSCDAVLCHLCNKEFYEPDDLRRHIFSQHPQENNDDRQQCIECKCFRRISPSFWAEQLFRCESCAYQHTHNSTSARAEPSPTIIISTSSSSLINQQPMQTTVRQRKRKLHQCTECPKVFRHASTLSVHAKTHNEHAPQFVCEYCSKPFAVQEYYVRHLRTHTGEKPFACDVCDKRFSQANTLTQHRRTHTGEKPYACTLCGKQFAVRDYLNKHIRVHTGEKPYGCPVCEKKYSQPSALRSHQLRMEHTNIVGAPEVDQPRHVIGDGAIGGNANGHSTGSGGV